MDLGQIIDDDATIIMTAMDNNGIRLNKAELEEGTFPKNEKDIVVSKGVLEELGIQGKLGDEITIPYPCVVTAHITKIGKHRQPRSKYLWFQPKITGNTLHQFVTRYI